MFEIKIAALLFSVYAPLSWLIAMIMSGIHKKPIKRHLMLLMAAASFVYIMTYAKFQGHLDFYTALFPIQALAVPLLFPLFYLYFRTITAEKVEYNWKYFIHYAMPILLSIIYLIISKIWMNDGEEKRFMINLLNGKLLEGSKFVFGYYFFGFGRLYYLLSSIFYLILISRCYSKYRVLILNIFPTDYTKELNWVKGIGFLLFGVAILNIVIHYMRNNNLASHELLIAVSYFTFGAFFYILGLYGFRQKEVYNTAEIVKTENFKEDVRILKKDIEDYLMRSKIYLNSDINIYHLCNTFKTNRTYLSAEINKQFGMNFRYLINSYRIQEAKKLIAQAKEKETVSNFEQIAIDSGFNSYGSFLRVFKMMENVSPSKFYKTIEKYKRQE